ncbi:MAG: endonuclease, partial [Clostridia bacterium]|nr:endonuclease [Clostridia bacterium]
VTEDTFTFHEFFHHNGERSVIDFVFISNGFKAETYHVIQDKINGTFPSDHCPVIAEVSFI